MHPLSEKRLHRLSSKHKQDNHSSDDFSLSVTLLLISFSRFFVAFLWPLCGGRRVRSLRNHPQKRVAMTMVGFFHYLSNHEGSFKNTCLGQR